MKKEISLKTFYLLGIIGFGLIGLAVGSTYAMFSVNSQISNPIALSTTLGSDSDIVDTIEITVPAYGYVNKTINVTNSTTNTINYTIWYLNDFSGNDVEIGIATTDENVTGTISGSGNKSVNIAIRNNSSSPKKVTIGVATSTNSIVLEESMKVIPNNVIVGPTAAGQITRLYNVSEKTNVRNNAITYQYVTTPPLIKDTAGNIRFFYGEQSPNYMYFNCSDYSNQSSSTCELWRIIGVFDGKLKIVRNAPIGQYSWDNRNTGTGAETVNGSNDWTTSRLMKLLNPGYENESVGGSLYWNGGSGTCYRGQNNATASCNFTSTGLKNDITRNMIADNTYSLLGITNNDIYSNQALEFENETGSVYAGRPTTWTGKVALPYASDYGYASGFDICSQSLSNYLNVSNCKNSNYIFQLMNGTSFHLLDTFPSSYFTAVILNGGLNINNAYTANYVLPTVYLEPSVTFTPNAGGGSSSSPYQIYVGSSSSGSGSSSETTTYTVSYNANGGSGVPSISTVTAGSTYTIPGTVPTYASNTFKGWYISGQSESVLYKAGDTITVNGNINFIAAWEAPATVTVTIKKSAGSITTLTTQTVNFGSSFSYVDNSVTSTNYTYSTTSCTNGQVASVTIGSSSSGNITVQSEENLSPNANIEAGAITLGNTISILSVTADTVCTMYYTNSSGQVTS